MRQQLKKCLMRTNSIFFVFMLLLLLIPDLIVANDKQQAKDKGKESAKMVHSQMDSPEKLKGRLINPVISQMPMKTFDNQTEFTPQISCPSSKDFARVSVDFHSNGIKVTINYDSNLDGTLDSVSYIYSAPVLCLNGFFDCMPGTLSDCRTFKVTFFSRRFYHQSISRNLLNECECVAPFCGFVLTEENYKRVLKKVGSMTMTAFMESGDTAYAVSEVKMENNVLFYYGQATSECMLQQGNSGTNPRQYYDPRSGIALEMAGSAEAESQMLDPNSPYSLIVSHATTGNSVYKECTIKKQVSGCSVIENSNCHSIDTNSCSIADEIWDGVQVIKAGSKTGLNPLGGCLYVCGGAQCFPWLERKIRYICPATGNVEDPTPRLKLVERTTVYNRGEGKIYYDDMLKMQSGGWMTYPNREIWIGEGEQVPECENVCKVKVINPGSKKVLAEKEEEEVPGVKKLFVPTNISRVNKDFVYYKSCKENVDGNYTICPLKEGEQLLEDCRCRNDFNQAILYMQAVRMAGQDMICSSGVKKNLAPLTNTKQIIFGNHNIPGLPRTGTSYYDDNPGGG